MGKSQIADALMHVPFEPAYDFYSALQCIWIVHMIASCFVSLPEWQQLAVLNRTEYNG